MSAKTSCENLSSGGDTVKAIEVWFSIDRGTKAENVFITHGWESGYRCAGGFRSHGLCKFQFLFCHLPLPDMPHLPTREVLVEFVKLR